MPLYNFVDDNTLSAFVKTILELIDKFQAILLDKRKLDHPNQRTVVYDQYIKVVSSVELLGIQIGDELHFNLHISNICPSAANQLNALFRLK